MSEMEGQAGRRPSSAASVLCVAVFVAACAIALHSSRHVDIQLEEDECEEGWAPPDCRQCKLGYYGAFCTPASVSLQHDDSECREGWAAPDCLSCSNGFGGDFCEPLQPLQPQQQQAQQAQAQTVSCDVGEEQIELELNQKSICSICPAGKFDHDRDPESPCRHCRPGFASPEGSVLCLRIRESPCEIGTQQLRPTYRDRLGVWQPAKCEVCAPGRWDHDRSATTPCENCRTGFHSPAGSIICVDVPT